MPLEVQITSEEKVQVTLHPTTLGGQPAEIQPGSVIWEILEGDATHQDDPGGMSSWLVSGEPNVTSVFQVSADADLGEGVITISDVIQLIVGSPYAKNLGLEAGPPELK